MIKKFNVTVNGTAYQVEVEEIKDSASSVQAPVSAPSTPAAPVSSTPAPAAPAASAPAPVAPGAGETVLSAPMPGTILNVAVSVGDQVKAGQLAVILEAMKMENELAIPVDGVVKAVHVTRGASVNTADILVVVG